MVDTALTTPDTAEVALDLVGGDAVLARMPGPHEGPLPHLVGDHPTQDVVQALGPLERDVVASVRDHVQAALSSAVHWPCSDVVGAGDHNDPA